MRATCRVYKCYFIHGEKEQQKREELDELLLKTVHAKRDIMSGLRIKLRFSEEKAKKKEIKSNKIAKQVQVYNTLLEEKNTWIEQLESKIEEQKQSIQTLKHEIVKLNLTAEISCKFTSSIKQRERLKAQKLNDQEDDLLLIRLKNYDLELQIDQLNKDLEQINNDRPKESIERLKVLEERNATWTQRKMRLVTLEHRNTQWKKTDTQLKTLEQKYILLEHHTNDIIGLQRFYNSYCNMLKRINNTTEFTIMAKKRKRTSVNEDDLHNDDKRRKVSLKSVNFCNTS